MSGPIDSQPLENGEVACGTLNRRERISLLRLHFTLLDAIKSTCANARGEEMYNSVPFVEISIPRQSETLFQNEVFRDLLLS